MLDDIDPSVKQYMVFSFVVAMIVSFVINFTLMEGVRGTFAYGFPINLNEIEGIASFFARIVNTLVMGLFLTIPMYFVFKWLRER
jgi:hypothetical protein